MSTNVIFFDIETFPNFFSNTLINKKTKEVNKYYISTFDSYGIEEMLNIYKNSDAWFCGYNNLFFDDRVIQWMINYFNNKGKTYSYEGITQDIYKFAQKCINSNTKKYKWGKGVQFKSIDLMRVGYLDKSLKMVATNLEWPLIQDLPYPHDHHVQKNQIQEILDYNVNDVEITKRLYEELETDIKLRGYMSKKYGENLMSDSNSGMANKLLNKEYAEATGQVYWSFKDDRTYYDNICFGSIISDKINFKTPKLQELLENIKSTTIHKKDNGNFEKFEYEILYEGTRYKLAKGGIHSENSYEIYESNDKYSYRELDWSSFYPFIMLNLGIYPKHLDEVFIEMFRKWVNERLEFKKQEKNTEADALKILINAVYGKLGSDRYWLYDPAALYAVTLNGQLFMFMLIEIMETNGFSVVYSNTDSVFVKHKRHEYPKFKSLYKQFEKYTDFVIDDELFSKLIIRDVNNYIIQKADGKVKRGGELNKNKHRGSWGIMRSFDKPIVPKAIEEYFLHNVPVEETIAKEESPMNFCMAQKAGKKFDVMRRYIEDNEIKEEQIQRTNRYFVSDTKGDVIYKKNEDREISMGGVASEHILLYNEPNQYPRDRVKDQYYIKECKKVISQFENKQGNLF